MSSLPLRILICDDELMARKRVARLLGEVDGVEVIFECESGAEALAKLRDEDVDLAILDIQMPGMTGLETVMQMPEERPYVIFLTAHPEHAVEAFDVGAVDYLLKPVDDARLGKSLVRARQYLDGASDKTKNGGAAKLNKLAIATRSGVELVNPLELTHATFDGTLVTVHTTSRTVLTDDTLQELETKLASELFERVHRRAILNMEHVSRLEAVDSGGYVALLSNGKRVDVSRQSARRLRRRLGLR